jgi:2-dehydro-3-deoxyphosphogluconate aldolase/(4S)-4-hydroxy-2-oxoglutarate aldolase
MRKSEVLQCIKDCGIVPAIRVESEVQALRAVQALGEGGICVAEVTMSMPQSERVLEQVILRFGDGMLIGAGTVLDAETASRCILAGAQFIVSPSLNPLTIQLCRRQSIAVFAGAFTPTEVLAAWSEGADCVKVFPVSAAGGASYIKALRGPFPEVELLPMGGVSLESCDSYLSAGCFALGVGSDLVNSSVCEAGSESLIASRAAKFRSRVENARAGRQEPSLFRSKVMG